jgi:pimeloyl-ACP methyl ester carboxylesterase
MVIGFLGGFVNHDARAHSTVQVVEHLRNSHREGVYVQSFANRERGRAYKEIRRRLDGNNDGILSTEEKQNARIVIFGHSWGAYETVALARQLERDGIPVMLTIQVDSVAKLGQNDSVIPANVGQAVNFYQPDGIIHGRPQIRAANPARTEILGNFRYDYKAKPVRCEGYPWFDNILVKAHTEIECDPKVWNQVESLIYQKLSPETRNTATR